MDAELLGHATQIEGADDAVAVDRREGREHLRHPEREEVGLELDQLLEFDDGGLGPLLFLPDRLDLPEVWHTCSTAAAGS